MYFHGILFIVVAKNFRQKYLEGISINLSASRSIRGFIKGVKSDGRINNNYKVRLLTLTLGYICTINGSCKKYQQILHSQYV